MVSIGEAKVVEGVVPEDFKEFFSRWHEPDVGIKANPILVGVEHLGEDQGATICKV